MNKKIDELLKLAEGEFTTVTPLEREVIRTAVEGGIAYGYRKDESEQSVWERDSWDDTEIINASFLYWLMTDSSALSLLPIRRIAVARAKIGDKINMEGVRTDFSISIEHSYIEDDIDLHEARIRRLSLAGTHCRGINANSIVVDGSLTLSSKFEALGQVTIDNASIAGELVLTDAHFAYRTQTRNQYDYVVLRVSDTRISGTVWMNDHFRADGPITFINSHIGGDLLCENGNFSAAQLIDGTLGDVAMRFKRISVDGSVTLSGNFEARGLVDFKNATIGGNLSCYQGKFINPDRAAIGLASSTTRGTVFMVESEVDGWIDLQNATIERDLNCQSGHFSGGLTFASASIGGNVVLEKASVENLADLRNVHIKGNLYCRAAQFSNSNGSALSGENATVQGICNFIECHFKGRVSLFSSKLMSDVYCDSAEFITRTGDSLVFTRSAISGSLFLGEGFKAEGSVVLVGASIGGNLDCRAGCFEVDETIPPGREERDFAIWADHIEVQKNVIFRSIKKDAQWRNTRTNAVIQFARAKINGDFVFRHVEFFGNSNKGLDLSSATIGRQFVWGGLEWEPAENRAKVSLNLEHSSVGQFCYGDKSWPDRGNVFLDDFVYGSLEEYHQGGKKVLPTLETLLDLLNRQPKSEFSFQPYEQLVRVLRSLGRESDAREALIEKRRILRTKNERAWPATNAGKLAFAKGLAAYFWSKIGSILETVFLDWIIGYGYKTSRTLAWSAGIVVMGFIVFTIFSSHLVPVKTGVTLPSLNELFYSLDLFLPIVNLHQEENFVLNVGSWDILSIYYWLHIVAGWVLVTLGIAGLTGIVKKD